MKLSDHRAVELDRLSREGVPDPRFLKSSGIEAFTGNELLVKGALEAGVGLITGYPGSPVSEVFDAIGLIAPVLAERAWLRRYRTTKVSPRRG